MDAGPAKPETRLRKDIRVMTKVIFVRIGAALLNALDRLCDRYEGRPAWTDKLFLS